MTKTNIIVCRCQAEVIDPALQQKLLEQIKTLSANVIELDDLCAFAVHEPKQLESIINQAEESTIVACYPRAVKNMLKQSNIQFNNVEVLNYRVLSHNEIVDKLSDNIKESGKKPSYDYYKSTLDVPAWFPVVDMEKCTHCGKCAHFCLFGVYAYKNKKLSVKSPLSCKNHCPACGRTCPSSAIMFPRLPEKSPLSGAEPSSMGIQLDNTSLLSALQQRNQKQSGFFAGGVVQQAEEERRKALEEYQKQTQKKK
jgi:ferredoxin